MLGKRAQISTSLVNVVMLGCTREVIQTEEIQKSSKVLRFGMTPGNLTLVWKPFKDVIFSILFHVQVFVRKR